MASNKHRAVWDWLQTCPYIGDLFFNAVVVTNGVTVLIPRDQLVEEYIDGSQKRNYICALTRFEAFSADPNDAENITVVTDLEDLGNWVKRQVRLGNLPAFPDGYTITDVRVLPNEAGFMVLQDGTMAKYMIEFLVEYIMPAEDDDDMTDDTTDEADEADESDLFSE